MIPRVPAALDAFPDEAREQAVIPGEAPVPDAIPPLSPVQDAIPSGEQAATRAEEPRAPQVLGAILCEALVETQNDSRELVSIRAAVATRPEAELLPAIRCAGAPLYVVPVALA